ncbi:MAG: antA/AntB antirepressor family protein [Gammaproteobacteria bacterium]
MAKLKKPAEIDLSEEIRSLQSTVIDLQATVISLLRQRIDRDDQETEQVDRMTGILPSDDLEPENGVRHSDWGGDLVPVFKTEIGGYEQLACEARALHEFLEVNRDFSTWIKERIDRYGFTEEDYSPNLGNRSDGKAGKPRKEYHLTLGMAKELAMVENNPNGRHVRRYFIDCERKLLDEIQKKPVEPNPGKAVTPKHDPLQTDPGFDPDYAEFLVFLNVTKGRMGRKNEENAVSIPTAKVLRWLWNTCIDENEWYTASKYRLGQELQMVHTTVSRCIRRLAEWGFLEQRKRKFTECRLIRSVVEPELVKAGGLRSPGSPISGTLPDLRNTGRITTIDMGFVAAEVGSASAAVFLAKAVEFQTLTLKAGREWWSVTREKWTEETGLSGREQATARKKLRKAGLLLEERRGMPSRLWYRLDGEALQELADRQVGSVGKKGYIWH